MDVRKTLYQNGIDVATKYLTITDETISVDTVGSEGALQSALSEP
jgi:hypothetical protein